MNMITSWCTENPTSLFQPDRVIMSHLEEIGSKHAKLEMKEGYYTDEELQKKCLSSCAMLGD